MDKLDLSLDELTKRGGGRGSGFRGRGRGSGGPRNDGDRRDSGGRSSFGNRGGYRGGSGGREGGYGGGGGGYNSFYGGGRGSYGRGGERGGRREPPNDGYGPRFNRGPRDRDRRPKPYVRGGGQSASTTIRVSNLDLEVNSDDVRDIFQAVGEVKSTEIQKNSEGKSTGVALVTFAKPGEAKKAVEEFDQAEVDGRPMAVQLQTGAGSAGKTAASVTTSEAASSSGGRGRGGRGRGRERTPLVKEDLDAELDEYNRQKNVAIELKPASAAAAVVEKVVEGANTDAAAPVAAVAPMEVSESAEPASVPPAAAAAAPAPAPAPVAEAEAEVESKSSEATQAAAPTAAPKEADVGV